MNVFERRSAVCKVIGFAGCALLMAGAAATVYVGITFGAEEPFFIIPMMCTIFAGMLPIMLGFLFAAIYRTYYRAAKVLFSEEELMQIKRPMLLQMNVAEKAKRLMEEGRMRHDMSAFNEFCQLASIALPQYYRSGFYYGGGGH